MKGILYASAVTALANHASIAQVVIDDFSDGAFEYSDRGPVTKVVAAPSALGGKREIIVGYGSSRATRLSSQIGLENAPWLTLEAGPATEPSIRLIYGDRRNPEFLVDVEESRADGFTFSVLFNDDDFVIGISMRDLDGDLGVLDITVPESFDSQAITARFDDFRYSGGAFDFSRISSIEFEIFRGSGEPTGGLDLALGGLALTALPSPGALPLAGLAMAGIARRRRAR